MHNGCTITQGSDGDWERRGLMVLSWWLSQGGDQLQRRLPRLPGSRWMDRRMVLAAGMRCPGCSLVLSLAFCELCTPQLSR